MNAALSEVIRQEVREWLNSTPTPDRVAHDMGFLLASLPVELARELAATVGTACVEYLDRTASQQAEEPEQREGE